MSAKESLLDIVGSLSEEDAADWLSRMQRATHRPIRRTEADGLSISDIARLPIEERHAILRAGEAEVDIEELEAWEKGTGSDLDLIDA